MADKERILKTFKELISINSPSLSERKVADYIKAALAPLGFEISEDDTGAKIGGSAGNVTAFLKGTVDAQPIFFGSHMDTVEPTEGINVIIDGDIIKTDGTTILGADDKAGITEILEGMRMLVESGKPHGDIKLVFDVSEETGLFGVRHYDTSGLKGYFGFIMDSEIPAGAFTMNAPSDVTINVEIFGKAAHAGMCPEKGVSALVAASRAIAKMKLGRLDEETTANVGTIKGGKARNIVPDYVTMRAEARSRNEAKLEAQLDHMKTLFRDEAAAMGAEAKIELISDYKTFAFAEDAEIVKFAAAALAKIGKEPVLQNGGGGSDANIFNEKGVPALLIAAGYNNAHTPEEYVSISGMCDCADFVAALAEA